MSDDAAERLLNIGDLIKYEASKLQTYKETEFGDYTIFESELEHPQIYTKARVFHWVRALPHIHIWNAGMCMFVLIAIVAATTYRDFEDASIAVSLDLTYNFVYLVYVAGFMLNIHTRRSPITTSELFRFILDAISYLRILTSIRFAMIACYLMRFNKPLEYLCSVKDYSMKGSVIGTIFKWLYLFLMVRVLWTIVILGTDRIRQQMHLFENATDLLVVADSLILNITFREFIIDFYAVDKIFIPIGTHIEVLHSVDQLLCVVLVFLGCMMVRGTAVASLALVLALYMLPEQQFRSRYRLIMKDLATTRKHLGLSQRVETFYRMFWKKHRAINTAALLRSLPPSLRRDIYSDIYFEAIQKSLILRELPVQAAAEVAGVMSTVHYIPGDVIVRRGDFKNTMFFIAYGAVELVTPEDDSTAVLRACRGSTLSACSGCGAAACARAAATVRAATFVSAFVLRAPQLWAVLARGRYQGVSGQIQNTFNERLEDIKSHFQTRPHPKVKFLSSIYHFKLGLDVLGHANDPDGEAVLKKEIFLEVAGCYRFRNKQDIFDPVCLRVTFPCILQPSSSVVDVWNMFIAMCTMVITVTYPYFLAFKNETPMSFVLFDQLMFVIFLLDLIVTISTGGNVEEGHVITLGQSAAQQARSRRFVVDVLAVLPVFTFIGSGSFGGINKLVKLPKMFRYLRLLEDSCVYYSHIIRFISYSLMVLIACYFIAAANQAAMCNVYNLCEVVDISFTPYWGEKYSNSTHYDVELKEFRRIAFGLYWAISLLTLTSHMLSWPPEFLPGTMYTLAIIEFVALLHIFIEAFYAASVMVTSTMSEDFKAAIGRVKEYLARHKINPTVQKRFITYLQLCWYTDEAYCITHKKQSIFHDLPLHVYKDIVANQNMEYIMTLPFTKYLKKGELKVLSSRLKLFYTSPNEILLNTGDVTNEFYLVKQGICEILCPVSKRVIGYVKNKGHFGVVDCILSLPVYYTIRAATHVHVYSINKKYLDAVLQTPRIKDAIDFTKATDLYAELHDRHLNPFVVYEPPPPPPNRYKFRLPKKYERDDDFQYPFAQLGFLSVLRYVFPRFSIRPDGKYLRRYEWFRAACALASAMLFPSYSYLSVQYPNLFYLRWLLDFSAYYDMLQRLLVAYFSADGVLVAHPASTAAHYLRNALLLDLLACLPLETLEPLRLQSPSHSFRYLGYRVIREHQFLMNNRLLQMYRFFNTLNELSEYIREDIVLVLKFLFVYLATCNVLTGMVVLFTVRIFYTDFTPGGRIWQVSHRQRNLKWNLTHKHSWVDEFKDSYRFNLTESPWNIHLATYFWVIFETTTTGYQSVHPTVLEHLELLFAGMFINKMITTYFAVRVISTRSTVNKALCKFQEQMRDLNEFMDSAGLDPTLQRKIQRYYEHNWDMLGGIESKAVLKMCDQVSLRTDTILQIYGPTFYECPILSGCDTSLLRILSRAMQDVHFLHDTEVVQADEVLAVMYVVNSGALDIQRVVDGQLRTTPLRRGSVFGNLDKEVIRIPLRAVSTSNVHLLEIKSAVFHAIIADFPDVATRMSQLRPRGECYISTAIKSVKHLRKYRRKAMYALELIENLENKVWTNHPAALAFLMGVSLLGIFSDIYHVGFQGISTPHLIAMYLLDALFFIKIPVLLSIPPHEEPPIKKKLKEFRRNYLRRLFPCDLLSVLPVETLCFVSAPVDWELFAWLRLNRLLRIPTIYRCLETFRHRMSINVAAMTITSMMVWFSIVMHATTCMWYYISRLEERAASKSSWRFDNNGTSVCEDEYMCSLYFMMTTTTLNGLGHILPRKHVEIIYIIFVQIFSKMLFMIFVGEFANIILYKNFRVYGYYRNCLELRTYLENNKVSMNLVKLVIRYSRYLWRETRGIQVPRMLSSAPPAVSRAVIAAAFLRHLQQHAVFKICEPAFLNQLVVRFRIYYYVEDMYVVRENEVTDSMYFIHKGCVQEMNKRTRFKRDYIAGQCFGSLQGLVRNQPFRFSYKTTSFAQILILNMDRWEDLLKFFPRSKIAIYGKTEGEDEDYHYPGSDDMLMPTLLSSCTIGSIESVSSNFSNMSSLSTTSTTRYEPKYETSLKKSETASVILKQSSVEYSRSEEGSTFYPTTSKEQGKSKKSPKSSTLKDKAKGRASFFSTVPFKLKKRSKTKITPMTVTGERSLNDSSMSLASIVMELPLQPVPHATHNLKTSFKSESQLELKPSTDPSVSSVMLSLSKEAETSSTRGISFHDRIEDVEDITPKENRQMIHIKYKEKSEDDDDDDNT